MTTQTLLHRARHSLRRSLTTRLSALLMIGLCAISVPSFANAQAVPAPLATKTGPAVTPMVVQLAWQRVGAPDSSPA